MVLPTTRGEGEARGEVSQAPRNNGWVKFIEIIEKFSRIYVLVEENERIRRREMTSGAGTRRDE